MSIIKTKDKQISTQTLKQMKNREKIVMVTAYDALFAKLLAPSADIILVGDSLNMSFGGHEDTLSVTMEQMIYHTNAVCKGAPDSFVVFDMPFGTYATKEEAFKNSYKVYAQTKAKAIKLEGGKEKGDIVKFLTQNSIAVLGHIGLLPQFVRAQGGYKITGKDDLQIQNLIEDAKAIEEAGAFAIVIEGVKEEAAKAVSEAVLIPTIGIGAGRFTDGQVLVWSDMFGFFEDFRPKFAKAYFDGATIAKEAAAKYAFEVKNGVFPATWNVY